MADRSSLDKLARAAEQERITATLLDVLSEPPISDLRELADAAELAAEAVDTARDAIEEWQNAEEREERADARGAAVEAVQALVDAIADLNAWSSTIEDVVGPPG